MFSGFSSGTRTVKTVFTDSDGQQRSETKTFNIGGPGGSNINYDPISVDGSGIGAGDTFGGRGVKFNYGGAGGSRGDGKGFGGVQFKGFSSKPAQSPRPKINGRPQRSVQNNPFAGLKEQDYSHIKNTCMQHGVLFEDPEFEADSSNIYFSQRVTRPIEWKRPHALCDDPQWITAGASRFDVKQGELGDCWLLAAVASLTCNSKLFNNVVPPDQSFTGDYCGLFRFNIWHQGDWQEIVVDDRLPSYNGQLVFMHSTEKNEFWSALLEKAYAKLNGSYESLKGGSTSEAMEDFTGGVTEMFELHGKQPPNLLNIMLKAHERGSLMGCSIDADPSQLEAELANGLIMGHAYSITAVSLMDIKTSRMQGQIPMVRVRNPWGNQCEWKGAWSDSSREWNLISAEEKNELGLKKDDDGEFWMSFKDFTQEFQKLEICNLGPDSLDEEELSNQKRWEMSKENGAWVRNVSAGGCRNNLESFWTNPQYRVTVTDPDEDEDDLCTVIVGLLQKDRRKKRKEGVDLLTIGYVIYKLPEDIGVDGPVDMAFFKYNASIAKSQSFVNMREVCSRHKLSPGTYCIIPSTFDPHQEGDFLVRIFTEKASTAGEIDERTSYADREQPHQAHTPDEAEKMRSLRDFFRQLAGDDMEIDAFELLGVLNKVFQKEFPFPGFSIDSTRSMVAMYDGDLSGKLGFDEFRQLWEDLRRWKTIFFEFDKDKSGNLNSYELRPALHHAGFRLSNRTLQSLVMRYSNRDGAIDFGDFVQCAVRLKTMIALFHGSDPENRGLASFNIETFIQSTMYS